MVLGPVGLSCSNKQYSAFWQEHLAEVSVYLRTDKK